MTLKKLFYWFWTTLIIGGGTSLVVGLLLKSLLGQFYWLDLLLAGLTFSAVSLLGFFAFLVFQWLAQGLLRTVKMYQGFLVILLLIVLINLNYLIFSKYKGADLWLHLLIPIVILGAAAIVAWLKVKWTHRRALIPTLFFMVVATTLEAITSLNPKGEEFPVVMVLFTVFILLVCNAWQVLQLHRLTQKTKRSQNQTS